VVSRPVREWDEFNGRINAINAVELRPRVTGYVQRIAYQEGAEVKQGDLMFVIDPRPYRVALDNALAQLERARATASLAQSLEKRAHSLIAAKAISSEEFDSRRANYAQSVADVHAAEAAVATARLNLGFAEVRAPISGRASKAMLTVGNLAVADQTLLTSVVSQDPVYVDFAPDEHSYLSYQELRRENSVVQAPDTVRVGLINEQGFPHLGQLALVDNQVDPVTGTIRMRAVVPNPDRLFTPGLYARVQLAGSSESAALLIDDKAVLTDQDRKYVYVLGPGDKALRRNVELGSSSGRLRVVATGLAIGDKVIVDGIHRIFSPGVKVKATEVSMEGPSVAVTVPPRAVAVSAE
jgi:membrane fusion protein, multidrug efflux system